MERSVGRKYIPNFVMEINKNKWIKKIDLTIFLGNEFFIIFILYQSGGKYDGSGNTAKSIRKIMIFMLRCEKQRKR